MMGGWITWSLCDISAGQVDGWMMFYWSHRRKHSRRVQNLKLRWAHVNISNQRFYSHLTVFGCRRRDRLHSIISIDVVIIVNVFGHYKACRGFHERLIRDVLYSCIHTEFLKCRREVLQTQMRQKAFVLCFSGITRSDTFLKENEVTERHFRTWIWQLNCWNFHKWSSATMSSLSGGLFSLSVSHTSHKTLSTAENITAITHQLDSSHTRTLMIKSTQSHFIFMRSCAHNNKKSRMRSL